MSKTYNLQVIYENKDFVVIDKPAGLLVHELRINAEKEIGADKRGIKSTTLIDLLLKKYPEIRSVGDSPAVRPGIVHRLDRDTSGVMVVARSQNFFDYLKNLFQSGKVKKTYLALVCGHPPKKGAVNLPIGLKSGTTKRSPHSKKMVKEAVTEYETVKRYNQRESAISPNQRKSAPSSHPRESAIFSLLKIVPKTGRTHQIRVHLNAIGHPVAGDKLYGGKRTQELGAKRQLLHAESIEFSTREGERVRFEAIPPDDFRDALKHLKPI